MINNIITIGLSLLLVLILSSTTLKDDELLQNLDNIQLSVDQTLSTHQRPIGYDDPALTEEVAKEIFYEAKRFLTQISHSGFSRLIDSETWIANSDHQVAIAELQRSDIFCFVPELSSNMDAFNLYFGQVFSDETLERLKNELHIFEYNERVVGVNFSAGAIGSSMIDWERSIITEIQQDEQAKTATVTVQPYYYGYEFSLGKMLTYEFEYLEEWGWRIVLDGLTDM